MWLCWTVLLLGLICDVNTRLSIQQPTDELQGKAATLAGSIATLQKTKEKWLHGVLSRFDAEALLRSAAPGSFLVRQTTGPNKNIVLSIATLQGLWHGLIWPSAAGYQMANSKLVHSSVDSLIFACCTESALLYGLPCQIHGESVLFIFLVWLVVRP